MLVVLNAVGFAKEWKDGDNLSQRLVRYKKRCYKALAVKNHTGGDWMTSKELQG